MDRGPAKLRAFVALEMPAARQRALAEFQSELKKQLRGPAFRWVKPEQAHLTLRFLGAITEDDANLVSQSLSRIAADTAAFQLGARGLGCFPNARRARVLWVGLAGHLETLTGLHAAVGSATEAIGEPPDDRPFSPHLTLARVKEPAREDLAALSRMLEKTFVLEPWTVASIHLMRSHLGPSGARHEVLSAHSFVSGVKKRPRPDDKD